jgi:hypothetical protein
VIGIELGDIIAQVGKGAMANVKLNVHINLESSRDIVMNWQDGLEFVINARGCKIEIENITSRIFSIYRI